MLKLAQDASAQCSEALTNAKSALSEYASLDTSHSIAYRCDGNDPANCEIDCAEGVCTCESIATDIGAWLIFSLRHLILQLIGDISAVRTEAFSESVHFRDESTSTVSRLVTYSNARAAYDAEYVANKSSNIRRALENTIDSLVTPFVAYVTF